MIGIPAAQTGLQGDQLNPGRISAGNVIVIGCVSRRGDGAAAAFIITDPRPKPPAQYRLEGDADLLSMHVGHIVEIGGPITSVTGGPGGADAAAPTLKVQSLIYISTSCSSQQK
jgi:hypothetical protein